MSKPKIYANCKAGCLWETVHKDDFDKSATWFEQTPNENSVYKLSPVKNYKIVSAVVSNAYSCVVSLEYTDVTAQSHTFEISEFDEYRNYFYFEILSLTATATALTIVYEVNGNRYTETVSGTAIDVTNATLNITGATDVLLHNDDAEIVGKGLQGDKGDKGDKGDAGANGTNGKDGADGKNGALYVGVDVVNGDLILTETENNAVAFEITDGGNLTIKL